MSEIGNVIEQLNVKLERLIELHQNSLLDNEILKEDNRKLKETISGNKTEIVDLNERIKLIKMAKTIEESGEDTSKLKLKINEIVREVDKCIGMLNK